MILERCVKINKNLVMSGQNVSLTWKSRLKSQLMWILFTSSVIKWNKINDLSKTNLCRKNLYLLYFSYLNKNRIVSIQIADIILNGPRQGIWKLQEIKTSQSTQSAYFELKIAPCQLDTLDIFNVFGMISTHFKTKNPFTSTPDTHVWKALPTCGILFHCKFQRCWANTEGWVRELPSDWPSSFPPNFSLGLSFSITGTG